MTDTIKEWLRSAIIDNVGILTMHPSAFEKAKEVAREEGRRAGMMEAAQIVRGLPHLTPKNPVEESFVGMARFITDLAVNAIESKAKEG